MPRNAVFGAIVLTLMATPVAADQHSGTSSEQDACRRDVVRHCKGVAQEDGVILDCLKAHHVKLSTPCRTVLPTHGQLPSP